MTISQSNSDMSGLSKRTFKQLNRDWEFNIDQNDDQDTLVAQESGQRGAGVGGQKRQIKSETKLVAKICRVVDLAKTQGRSFSNIGFKQQETVTSCFSTVIIDIAKDYMY